MEQRNKVAAGSLDDNRTGGGAFSFANARALEKRASSMANPTLMMKLMDLITYSYESVKNTKDISKAIAAEFPTVENVRQNLQLSSIQKELNARYRAACRRC